MSLENDQLSSVDNDGENNEIMASDFVPLYKLKDAKDVYERLRDLQAQVKRQERRIEILQIDFDQTPVDQNRRIGRHLEAAKGRWHLLNVGVEEAEEKLIEVSLPWALVLMRELENQIARLEKELTPEVILDLGLLQCQII